MGDLSVGSGGDWQSVVPLIDHDHEVCNDQVFKIGWREGGRIENWKLTMRRLGRWRSERAFGLLIPEASIPPQSGAIEQTSPVLHLVY